MNSNHNYNAKLNESATAIIADDRELLRANLGNVGEDANDNFVAMLWQAWACESLQDMESTLGRAFEIEPESEVALAGLTWVKGLRASAEHQLERKRQAEEEARLKAEEEARLKAEEEARLKAEEEARVQAEQEAQAKAEEDARLKAEQEAKAKAEEDARLKAEEVARLQVEQEAQAKAEEEERLKSEEEARLKAEEEARLQAEQEAQAKAEEDARLKADQEAKAKAEEDARLKADQEAKAKAEEDVQRMAEEARSKAEETAMAKAEEARLMFEEQAAKAEEEARQKAEETRFKAEQEARLKAQQVEKEKQQKAAHAKIEEARIRAEAEEAELDLQEQLDSTTVIAFAEPVAEETVEKDSNVEPASKVAEPCDVVEAEIQETVEILAEEVRQEVTVQDPEPNQPAPVTADLPTESKKVILTVDDSPTIRKLVSLALSGQGYEVITAEDGSEALFILGERLPDLILSDINMPKLGGYKLCKFVKKHERTKNIPVIMLSGKDGVFDKMRGKLSGCDDFIAKPFETAELIAKVQQHLSSIPSA